MEQNITDRWSADMNSDSWLSKNVRPLVLVFLVVSTVLMIFIDAGTTLVLNASQIIRSDDSPKDIMKGNAAREVQGGDELSCGSQNTNIMGDCDKMVGGNETKIISESKLLDNTLQSRGAKRGRWLNNRGITMSDWLGWRGKDGP